MKAKEQLYFPFSKVIFNNKNIYGAKTLHYKGMIQGELMEEMDKNLPFKLNVSQFRRKKIIGTLIITYKYYVRFKIFI